MRDLHHSAITKIYLRHIVSHCQEEQRALE
jgi:hypothetical protein